MSKVNLNKISVKQQGGQMIPTEPGMRNEPQVNPAVMQMTEQIQMSVQGGQDIIDIVVSLTEQGNDQQLISQALMMGGMEEQDIFSVFEQVQERMQPAPPSTASEVNANPQLLARNEELEKMPTDFLEGVETDIIGKSGIEIKPENRGKFTKWAKSRGMGVQEAARKVLANKDKYPPSVVKMANFARNAAKFKKEEGGETFPDLTGDGQVTQADILKGRGVFQDGGERSLLQRFTDGALETTIDAVNYIRDNAFVNEDDDFITKAIKNQNNPLLQADNLLQLSGVPANLVREIIEGVSDKGDGEFNAGNIIPDFYGTTILTGDEAQVPVSETLGIDNTAGAIATDMALDPLSYVGAGVVRNAVKSFVPKIAKFIGRSADNLGRLIPREEGGEPDNEGFRALPDYVQDKIMKREEGGDLDFSQQFLKDNPTYYGGGYNPNSYDQNAVIAGMFGGAGSPIGNAVMTGLNIYGDLFGNQIDPRTGLKRGVFRDTAQKRDLFEMNKPLYYDYKVEVDDSEENIAALADYYKAAYTKKLEDREWEQMQADIREAEARRKLEDKQINIKEILENADKNPLGLSEEEYEVITTGFPLTFKEGGPLPKAQSGIPSFEDYMRQFSQTDYMRDTQNIADLQLQQRFPDLGPTPQQQDDQMFFENLIEGAQGTDIEELDEVVVTAGEPTLEELLANVNLPEVKPTNPIGGTIDMAMDSPAMKQFAAASDAIVGLSSAGNAIFDEIKAYKAGRDRAENLFADNLFATMTDDPGLLGNWNALTGQFRGAKSRIPGYDNFFQQPSQRFSREGGEKGEAAYLANRDRVIKAAMAQQDKKQKGGQVVDLDQDMITQLIAAGADIEIL
jgi:hypothetical protein